MILALRTDNPQAELYLRSTSEVLARQTWTAHKQLAETLHTEIAKILQFQEVKLDDLTGLVLYAGPGSFTGLRIGASVANAIAHSFAIPIVAATGEAWIEQGLTRLKGVAADSATIAVPDYGSPAHTTSPKK